MAVCLLGRLGEKEDEAVLRQIAFAAEEYDLPMYSNRNGLYFNMVTHAGAALLRLYEKRGWSPAELESQFVRLLEEGVLAKRVAAGGGPEKVACIEIVDYLKEMIRATQCREG